jgi:GTP cyclohydrolase III
VPWGSSCIGEGSRPFFGSVRANCCMRKKGGKREERRKKKMKEKKKKEKDKKCGNFSKLENFQGEK